MPCSTFPPNNVPAKELISWLEAPPADDAPGGALCGAGTAEDSATAADADPPFDIPPFDTVALAIPAWAMALAGADVAGMAEKAEGAAAERVEAAEWVKAVGVERGVEEEWLIGAPGTGCAVTTGIFEGFGGFPSSLEVKAAIRSSFFCCAFENLTSPFFPFSSFPGVRAFPPRSGVCGTDAGGTACATAVGVGERAGSSIAAAAAAPCCCCCCC